MAEIVTMAEEELRKRGKADAAELAAQELLEQKAKVPTWRARDFSQMPVGTPYKFEDMVYKLIQPHDATDNPDWTPPATPAMWAAVSKEGEDGTLENPITAARGMEYVYGKYYRDPEDGKLYLCKRTGEEEGGKVTLQFLPHELVAQYFEEVQG